jgi:hypothetical protein
MGKETRDGGGEEDQSGPRKVAVRLIAPSVAVILWLVMVLLAVKGLDIEVDDTFIALFVCCTIVGWAIAVLALIFMDRR